MNSWSGLPGVAGSNVRSYSKDSTAVQKKENLGGVGCGNSMIYDISFRINLQPYLPLSVKQSVLH